MGMNLLSWNSSCSDTGSSVNLFSPLTVPLSISSLPSTVQTLWILLILGVRRRKIFFFKNLFFNV